MKFLLIHNAYQNHGGEDILFETERRMLIAHGNEVIDYCRHNEEISRAGIFAKLTLPVRTVWAWDSYRAVLRLCESERPSCAIVFNTLPLISPAIIYACRAAGVPVIQHIQNYRLVCAAGTCFRNGHACRECLDNTRWRGVRYGCYRGSRLATANVAVSTAIHSAAKTWSRKVSVFVAPSAFVRQFVGAGGIPSERIQIKPNCVEPDPGSHEDWADFALYAGRLSAEKGVRTLLHAWRYVDARIPLHIAGDGPLHAELASFVREAGLKNVKFLGKLSQFEVLSLMRRTRLFIFPTECYEGFPMSVVEAFACGTPILASQLGSICELIRDGENGCFFRPGDPEDLANKASSLWMSDTSLRMGYLARREYERKYTAQRNHARLIEILQSINVSGPLLNGVSSPALSRV